MKATNNKLEHNDCQHPKGCGILILVAKNLVLILQLMFDQLFGVIIK
jgi:hypothetical protein